MTGDACTCGSTRVDWVGHSYKAWERMRSRDVRGCYDCGRTWRYARTTGKQIGTQEFRWGGYTPDFLSTIGNPHPNCPGEDARCYRGTDETCPRLGGVN